jgi:lauroyl/myristoyl acyltransferase
LAGYFTPRELKVLTVQLSFASRQAPSLAGLEPQTLLKQMYGHIGESVAELSQFKYLLESKGEGPDPVYKRIEVEGTDACREVKDGKEGGLFLSGHLGNFELLAAYHISNGIPLTILGREPNYKFLSRWIQGIRTNYGGESLLRGAEGENKRGAAVASIRALQTGKALALLPDQDTSLASEFVPFFGLPAAHVVAPIKLAVKSEKKVYSSFIARVGKLRHRVFSERIYYDPKSENPERDILIEYSKRFQRLVTIYPEQYLWIHRRWRRRPGIDYDKNPQALRSNAEYLDWLSGDPT